MQDFEKNPSLCAEEKAIVDRMSKLQIRHIDEVILSHCSDLWQKQSKIVGLAMLATEERLKGLSDVYYTSRVYNLIADGRLESKGDPCRMRYCEIRLAN